MRTALEPEMSSIAATLARVPYKSFGRQVPLLQEQLHVLQDNSQLGLPQAGNHQGTCRSVAVRI